MKIIALRGLAQFVSENKIEKLLVRFISALKKRPDKTPYNYQEYELLRGENALPYLANKYHYDCFQETLKIVEKQYGDMPEAFKGHFTIDSKGEIVRLRSIEKSSRMMDDFFKKQKMR